MSKKFTESHFAHAAKAVSEGKRLIQIAKEIGFSADIISKHLRKRGIEIPIYRRTGDRIQLPEDEIVTMYQGGQSEQAIAKHFNVARHAIRRRLERAGIKMRGIQEAQLLRFAQASEEARKAITKAANLAVTGITWPHNERVRWAQSREQTGKVGRFGKGEAEFATYLTQLGIDFVRQKAVDVYNVDFAVGPVAVELTCGTLKYRGGNAVENKRIKKLLECGYNPICVEFSDEGAICPLFMDQIISLVEKARGLPPFKREYWVIRCRTTHCAVVRNELGQFSRVETPIQLHWEWKIVKL